ncbi:hypothetical protein [Rhodoferax sp.]|uniref:hypothetical protein n=1 Tax=Rhodoferax sp. TaxID=50421 RepID=UPI002ACEC386|nr:hypothetical protein [Rhodoferax sp.]MDZ7919256.1 hypothetical protein [Rhodoferax sp.]
MKKIAILIVSAALSACSTPQSYNSFFNNSNPAVYKTYAGESRNAAELGVVVTDSIIDVVSIDGRPLDKMQRYGKKLGLLSGERVQFHMEPGSYVFELCFSIPGPHGSRCDGTLKFPVSVVSGQYQMLVWKNLPRNQWTASVQDALASRSEIDADFRVAMAVKQ